MGKVVLTVVELKDKLQELCYEGYSQSEVVADIEGFTTAIIEGVEVVKESERVLLKVAI